MAIYVMITKIKEFYPFLTKLLHNDLDSVPVDNKLSIRQMYTKMIVEKERKTVLTPPLLTHSQQKMEELVSKKI